ncbi:MAG: AAA family ATPase [gamma proteobacterium symbiont of Bathyaustriella thionipta]|nr:AAA family ATPase [gamma proteobacterium symbiont of Bathyaustriella thionipta]
MITVVGSLKGGSGKSTVTFNLAVWLSRAGVRLDILDLDPQATLRDVVAVRSEEGFNPVLQIGGVDKLDTIRSRKSDETLIDVGTANLEAMRKAVSLADRIIVPVPPSQADIWSTQRFLKFVKKNTAKNKPEIIAFINRGDTHHSVRESDEAAAALIALPGITFIKPRLAQRTAFRRSFSEGLAVFELSASSKGAREFSRLCAKLYPEHLS